MIIIYFEHFDITNLCWGNFKILNLGFCQEFQEVTKKDFFFIEFLI